MNERAKHLRTYFIVALLLFVSGTVALTTYSLWRGRNDAILNGIEISSMNSRSFEDFITQSLHVTELAGANIVGLEGQFSDPGATAKNLFRTLRHTPFLRSISLINNRAAIIASSNVANIGIDVVLDNYLPSATKELETLRIGIPWSGRDFADGQPGAGGDKFSRFIPLVRTLIEGGQASTLLINLNPDYFINHMSQKIDIEEGTVEIVRYDGILLMSTDPDEQPGTLREYVTRELQLSEEEVGEFERDLGDGRHVLTAFRASKLYPFVAVTNINRDYVLRHWKAQAQTLLGVVVPALLVVILLAVVFYRRQIHFFAQQDEYERLQRINATVFDASTEATLITDVNAKIISINPAFTRVTGYRPEEVIGHLLTEFMTADDTQNFFESVNSRTIEIRHRCKDGSLIWAEILSTPECNDQGDVTGFYRISRNITDRKQAQLSFNSMVAALRESEERFRLIAESASDVIWTIDPQMQRFSYISPSIATLLGWSADDALSQPLDTFMESDSLDQLRSVLKRISAQFTGQGAAELAEKIELEQRSSDGRKIPVEVVVSAIADGQGQLKEFVGISRDITERKKVEEKLKYRSTHDSQTDLYNRAYFDAEIERIADGRHFPVSFITIDLDGLKLINDTHGHDAGDLLIKAAAQILRASFRAEDMIARVGGDEFVAVLTQSDTAAIKAAIIRIRDCTSSYNRNYPDLPVSMSLGGATAANKDEISVALKQSDALMYADKIARKKKY